MKIIKLTEICNPKQWKTLSTEQLLSSGYSVYGANGKIGYFNDYNHENPTVMITCRGATCGAINLSEPKSWINGNAMCLDDLSENVNLRYLVHYLSNYDFRNVISGSAQPQITRENLNKVTIKLYDPKKQEEIANNLDKIKKIIEQHKSLLLKYDTLIKSRFIELFGDPILNPMGWEVKKLGNMCSAIMNGTTPKGGEQVYVQNGVIFLRSQNVWRNRIDLEDVAYIDEATHKSMEKSSLKKYDILMTKTGRINTENSSLGRAAIFLGEDNSANINGHVYLIRLYKNYNHEFVIRILTSPEYRDYIRSVCVGGIDKRQVNKDHIEDFPIIQPPISLQQQFASFVQQIDKSKFAIQKSLEKAETLYKSLMQEYFG